MGYVYGTTYGDLGLTPSKTSWRMLRELRHAPPGLAREDETRGALFRSSLEQSEQFFRAAETVGPETRALLLFYGLAQSGRALRAASQSDGDWSRDGGHGLTIPAEQVSERLADCVVKDAPGSRKGHFGYVAAALGRASLPHGQAVGELSRLLWMGPRFPLAGRDPEYRPLRLELDSHVQSGGPLRAELHVPAATWEMEMPPVGVLATPDFDRYRAHVHARLEHYPTLRGAQFYEPAPGHFSLNVSSLAERELALFWPDLEHPGPDGGSALHRFSDDNGRAVTVYPRGVGSTLAVHPYLVWWAILFAMAHYVRYEPVTWATVVDVDSSSEAVAIEHIGEQALSTLPELIHRTLVRDEPQD